MSISVTSFHFFKTSITLLVSAYPEPGQEVGIIYVVVESGKKSLGICTGGFCSKSL